MLQRDTALALRTIAAEPAPLAVNIERAALIIIDMQRDFLLPGGFGAALGNDVSRLNAAVGPCREVLAAARKAGMLIMHTREGHRPDLSDAPGFSPSRATGTDISVWLCTDTASNIVDPDTWLTMNSPQEGSWLAWGEWLAQRSAAPVPPPPLGRTDGKFAPPEDAPGRYVLMK